MSTVWPGFEMVDATDGVLHRDAADRGYSGAPVCDPRHVLDPSRHGDIRDQRTSTWCRPCWGDVPSIETLRERAAERSLGYIGRSWRLRPLATDGGRSVSAEHLPALRALVAVGALVRQEIRPTGPGQNALGLLLLEGMTL